ncbi:MAG TPA: AtpZ/AtpI family protein [Alphaproteobacteria bacterium]|nr:phosphoribosylaminoimidazolecarboxamide formyltransferase [Rhodospirillaceae bacterium]HRJ66455.1 AtpZ/AtpI family protein [Alphaproteobacteria bacterium]
MNDKSGELARKIRAAQERQRQIVTGGNDGSGEPGKDEKGKALRAGTDLVAALAVGIFLGYWVDRWLDTKPWGVIFFVFVGFAAGFLNIYRSQTGQDYKVGFKPTVPDAPKDGASGEDGKTD